MQRVLIAAVILALSVSGALATQCRDSSGKFIKCPPPTTSKPVHCKNSSGQFAKCGTPGAHPV
jgi:hypothetical protein